MELGREQGAARIQHWQLSTLGAKMLLGQELKVESFEDYFELLHTFKLKKKLAAKGGKSARVTASKTASILNAWM